MKTICCLAALVGACMFASLASASNTKAEIHHQLKRYYHADGYIKAIGRVAHRTIYNSNDRIRHKWKRAVHWLISVRDDATRKLHALRDPPEMLPGIDSCLDRLIQREGGYNPHKWNGGYVGPWDPYSTHGGSGAYGAPQALPGNKMASAGPDWRDNLATQIRWMIGYVNGTYGGSCAALAHSYAYGWY